MNEYIYKTDDIKWIAEQQKKAKSESEHLADISHLFYEHLYKLNVYSPEYTIISELMTELMWKIRARKEIDITKYIERLNELKQTVIIDETTNRFELIEIE